MNRFLQIIIALLFCLILWGCPDRRAPLNFQTIDGEKDKFVISNNDPDFFITIGGIVLASVPSNDFWISLGAKIKLGQYQTDIIPDSLKVLVYGQRLQLLKRKGPNLDAIDGKSIDLHWIFDAQLSDLEIPLDKKGRYQEIPIDIFFQGVVPNLSRDLIPKKITAVTRRLEKAKARHDRSTE